MAGITFGITVQLENAEAELSALVQRMDERRGFYKNVAQLLFDSSLSNFRKQSGPDGAAWTPLKPTTIRQRTRRGQLPIEILSTNNGPRKTGSGLRGSIAQASDNDSASVGVADRDPVRRYAAIHQFGGTIPIPARKGRIYRHYDPATSRFGRRFVAPNSQGAAATEVDVPAHSIRIPARPYIGVSPADEQEILGLAIDWLGFS